MAPHETVPPHVLARVGTVIRGKYRIDSLLGVGGMAVVYKATHRNQAEFAIKMLHAELSLREDLRTRFLREGYAANSVKHSGAVLVVDDDVADDGSAFLVMEFLKGAPVDDILEKRCAMHMSPRLVMAIGYQMLDVLASAHDKGIVHRDIKPQNLFVTKEGVLKVLDFGIARVRDALSSGAQATGTGMLLGTPSFMAPEQALAKSSEIDGKTDVWAAGATLFTLLSGNIVHQGDNAPQVMVAAATSRARPVQSVQLDVPAPLAEIVDRALSFEKDARPTAAAMRDALERCYLSLYGEPPSVAPLAAFMRSETVSSLPVEATRVMVPTPAYQAPSAPSQPIPATTARPVSLVDDSAVAGGSKRLVATLVAGGIALLLVLAVIIRLATHSSTPASITAAGTSDTSTPTAVAPQLPTAPVVQQSVVPSSIPVLSLPVAAASSTVKPTAVASHAAPQAAPSTARSATPPPASTPSCHLVSTLDADGNPHFKQVCDGTSK